MYRVYCDGTIIYNPNIKELAISEAVVTLELNSAGSFSFKLPPTHPAYEMTRKFRSRIEVYSDDELIFAGRPSEIDVDYFKIKKIYCEGELAYLNDSVQRPSENHDITVRGFLEFLVANHNSQVDSSRTFKVGAVTVTDSNDSLYRYTNYETTLECVKKKLIETLGGYLMVRCKDGERHLDYLKELPNTCSQTISFGVNLLDYASNIDISEVATRVIPLGATLENSRFTAIDERLTVESVNDGKDYVQSDDAVEMYGIITQVKTWDDVTLASNLKAKGQEYLESVQWENMKLEVTAVDLHNLDSDVDMIGIGDQILVVSKPHGLKRYFPVSKLSINLQNPANNKITLGVDVDTSITTQSNAAAAAVEETTKFSFSALLDAADSNAKDLIDDAKDSILDSANENAAGLVDDAKDSILDSANKSAEDLINTAKISILESAKDNATELIQKATNGYIVLNLDKNGKPKELLIMDTADVATATKVWRWNVNGLAYSNTGYNGKYGLAMTMDGSIVADFITAGTMMADRIKGGTLILGGANNVNGNMQVKDANGNVIVTLTEKGIDVKNGTITGSKIQNAESGRRAVLDASSALKGYHDEVLYNLVDVASQGDEVQMTLDAKEQITIRTPKLCAVNQSFGEGEGVAKVTSTGNFTYVTDVKKNTADCTEQWVGSVYCTLPVFLDVTKSTIPHVLGMRCTGESSATNRV